MPLKLALSIVKMFQSKVGGVILYSLQLGPPPSQQQPLDAIPGLSSHYLVTSPNVKMFQYNVGLVILNFFQPGPPQPPSQSLLAQLVQL